MRSLLSTCLTSLCTLLSAATYNVGPNAGQLNAIGDVPWESLQAGDTVYIHWRAAAYKEKWVINRQGTAASPIRIIGVPNGNNYPVITGNGASTRQALSYWNEKRSIIKIGGSSIPANDIARYIEIENLEIRSARPAYAFTDDYGNPDNYAVNAASIHIERGQHITVRNCIIHDSANGIFCGISDGDTQDILIDSCHLYDNGINGSYLEHNTYTSAVGITYQYCRFGSLRSGCLGNNLKDRSVGTTIRYCWIESANRQIDLVDVENTASLYNNPAYRSTYVYGNVLIEPDSGNRQIIHYGGDSGNTSKYRKGTLYLYNNTVVSTRSGRTTLLRLSTNSETCDARNNLVYVTASGSELSMVDSNGTLNLRNNWFKNGYVNCHSTLNGSVNNLGGNITGSSPQFTNLGSQDFTLLASSAAINAGTTHSISINNEYKKHHESKSRTSDATIDIGAFEYVAPLSKRRIRILLPHTLFNAEISPNGTYTDNGTTQTFDDLNANKHHHIDFRLAGAGG